MKNSKNYKIGQKVNFTTSSFGGSKTTKTNEIKRIDIQEDGSKLYRIGGIGKAIFGYELKGEEDWYGITEENLKEVN
jgi:hypothetical protein